MKKTLLLCLCAAFSFAAPLRAETPPQFDRVQRADGARMTPDRFLRAYDPLTIFFPGDVGPKSRRRRRTRRPEYVADHAAARRRMALDRPARAAVSSRRTLEAAAARRR